MVNNLFRKVYYFFFLVGVGMADDTISISVTEFTNMQKSLLEFKQKAYDAEATTAKLKQQLNQKTQSSGWFGSSGNNKQTEALQQEVQNLQRSLSQSKEEFEAQSNALKDNIRSLFEENEKLQEQLSSKGSPSSTTSNGVYEKEIESLKAENDDLKTQILRQQEHYTQELSQLKEEYDEKIVKLNSELLSSKSNDELITNDDNENEKTKQELDELRNSIVSFKDEIKKQKEIIEQQNIRIKEIENEKIESEKKLKSKSDKEISKLKENIDSLLEEKQNILSSQLSSEELKEIQKKEKEENDKIIQSTKEELKKANEKIKELNSLKEELNNNIKTLSNEKLALQKSLSEEQEKISIQKETTDSVSLQLVDTSEKLKKIELENENLKNRISNLEDGTTQTQDDLAEQGRRFGEQLANVNEELTQAKWKLEQAEKQKKQAEDELKKVKELSEEQVKKYKIEADNAKEELSLTQEDREAIISKVAKQNLDIDELKDKLQSIQSNSKKEIEDLKKKLESEKIRFEKDIKKKNDESKEQKSILEKEILSLQKKLSDVQKEQEKRIEDIESTNERVTDFQELVSLKTKKIQELRETIDNLRKEIENKENHLKEEGERLIQAHEELNSVKTLLTNTTEKYDKKVQEINTMAVSKEEVVNQNRTTIENLKKEKELIEKEYSEKLTNANNEIKNLKSNTESESQAKSKIELELDSIKNELNETKNELENEKKQRIEFEEKSNLLSSSYNDTKSKLDEYENRIKELEQEIIDAKLENGIELKKSQRLIKDLQTQLQKARDKPSHPTVSRTPSTPTRLVSQSRDEIPIVQSSPKQSTKSNSTQVPPPSQRRSAEDLNASSVPQDIAALGKKVGDLQKRNFQLEEHIKQLRAKIQKYRQELEKKNKVIHQHLANLTTEGRSTASMDVNRKQRSRESGVMSKLFGSREGETELQTQINAKMTRVLEDTILKNVQLQSDMEIMGNEIMKLEGELKQAKDELAKLQNDDIKKE